MLAHLSLKSSDENVTCMKTNNGQPVTFWAKMPRAWVETLPLKCLRTARVKMMPLKEHEVVPELGWNWDIISLCREGETVVIRIMSITLASRTITIQINNHKDWANWHGTNKMSGLGTAPRNLNACMTRSRKTSETSQGCEIMDVQKNMIADLADWLVRKI